MQPTSKIIFLFVMLFLMPLETMANISRNSDIMTKQTLMLETSINNVSSGYEILFRLTNNSKKTMRIEKAKFHRSNIVLSLLEDKSHGDVLKEDLFPDGLTAGDWEISPGDFVETSLNLSSRFPALNNKSKERIIVFWKITIKNQTFGGYLDINNENNMYDS